MPNMDGTILNYALTLEYLEDTFYKEGLAKYTQLDFAKAGINDANFRSKLVKVGADESTHVAFLSAALTAAKVTPVKRCTYRFPYNNAAEFVALASVLEGVGVAAYLGAAASITNKDYLTAAGSILTVEARHNAIIRANGLYQSPFAQAFDTPLGVKPVFSLAAPFIVECPRDSPSLGVTAFPAFTYGGPSLTNPGSSVTFMVPEGFQAPAGRPLYVAWPAITGPVFTPARLSGRTVTTSVPPQSAAGVGPAGQTYPTLTGSNSSLTDDTTLAGPAIVNVRTLPISNE